jgi:hypothetical protein
MRPKITSTACNQDRSAVVLGHGSCVSRRADKRKGEEKGRRQVANADSTTKTLTISASGKTYGAVC